MSLVNTFRSSAQAVALFSTCLLGAQQAFALPVSNVSKAVALAKDMGRVGGSQAATVTVTLKLHNRAEYDKRVGDLYDPKSASFHKWFTDADFAKYAPTATEFETVKGELLKQGFAVVSSDPGRYSLRVRGTNAIVEKAFQTEIHTMNYKGKTFQAHTVDARLTGDAGDLVSAVSGLERRNAVPQIRYGIDPRTQKPLVKKVNQDLAAAAASLTPVALSTAHSFMFTTPGAPLPTANYFGTIYDGDATKTVALTPGNLWQHYGINSLIKQGYDGRGQTIALVEAYGYPYALSDANQAAKLFGLPALTSANFSVIYPEGQPLYSGSGALIGWDGEIALDVQSAHGIAPGAKIVVLASSGQDNEDFIASLDYVITHKIANTVSNSWEIDTELIAGNLEEAAYTDVLERGAAAGISFQFSTGDGGDEGLGPGGGPQVPSNNPYATGVGGTSILFDPYGSYQVTTGWGNGLAFLNEGGVVDPPLTEFYAGAGGGESNYFAKPSWQSAAPGGGRQVPDVSALADPFTGFPVVLTTDDGLGDTSTQLQVIGGTSLASPIFTAIWAIADEYNGKPLGFAAPEIANLKAGQILDVVPYSNLISEDVTGSITDASGTTNYTSSDLFAYDSTTGEPFYQPYFPTAVFPAVPGVVDLAISFGSDSALVVTTGYDNVTGFGEPNGLPFIQGVSHKTKGAPVPKNVNAR